MVVLHPYLPGFQPNFDKMVEQKKQLLLDYVKAGGGMLFMRVQGWQFGKDIDALNAWLKPADIEVLPEQVVDKQNEIALESGYKLSWTGNLATHPVTEGVRGLFYTTYFGMYSDSTSPVKVGKEWVVLARGTKTAKSLRTTKGDSPAAPAVGTYPSEPPLVAVRDYGKGRLAVWPVNATLVWQDGYHMLWGRGLVMEGGVGHMHGDAARLMGNLMTYLAEPSRARFGGFVPQKAKPKTEVGFVRINWDKAGYKGAYGKHCFVGLVGAKSSLSSGTGTPEQFIEAARKVGYDFIGFTEDLDKLTPDKFKQLGAVCKAASTETFKAYPGFAYLDESGNSWVTFSDRLKWPAKGWLSRKHPGRIKTNNPLSRGCQWPPVVLIKSHSNPEKPFVQGNFKCLSLYTYENGKLVDDSLDVYLRLQRMRFQLVPMAVHIVTSPQAVKHARTNGFQTYVRWFDHNMVEALSSHIGRYKGRYVFTRTAFVSNGPVIEDARITNFATSDLAIPENDRIRIHVRATSPKGLKEVVLLDGDRADPMRRYLPAGAKVFDTLIDLFHDRQYNLIVRATDSDGRVAIGWNAWTGVQENSYPRCSDNLNTMPRGKWWGQPAHLHNVRGIENYLVVRNFRYMGLPAWHGLSESLRPAVEFYPVLVSRFGTIVDCRINDHYPPTVDGNSDRTDRPECAVANQTVTGVVRHTMFTPWQDGSMIELVEGDFTAKKAFTLNRAEIGRFHGRRGADCVSATLADGTLLCGKLTRRARAYAGPLPANGFVAAFPQPFRGSIGFIPLHDRMRFLAFNGGRDYTNLRLMLGADKRRVAAGDKLAYRYIGVIGQLDGPPNNRFVAEVRHTLGLVGKPAYTVTPSIGQVTDTRFTLKLKAQGHGFAATVSQARLPLHLPTLIKGLNPRWHAGIWYKGTCNFMVAEWVVNDMNQRHTVRRRRRKTNEIHHFPVMPDGTGMLQIDTAYGSKKVSIGNLLVAGSPDVCLTLVDWRPKRSACVVHNPTDRKITCTVRPGPGFTLLGQFQKEVTVPAGSSVKVTCGVKGDGR